MLRNRALVMGAVSSLLVIASVTVAGTLDKGASEIAGSAGFTSTSYSTDQAGDSSIPSLTTVTADVKYGYCLTRNWEIAPQVMVSSLSRSGYSQSNYAGAVSGIYNFALAGNTLVPYLELGAGFGSTKGIYPGSGTQNYSILPLGSAGVRFLLGNSASINAAAVYTRETTKVDALGYTLTQNVFGAQVGVSVFPMGFGKK